MIKRRNSLTLGPAEIAPQDEARLGLRYRGASDARAGWQSGDTSSIATVDRALSVDRLGFARSH